jgi:dTMP kinase
MYLNGEFGASPSGVNAYAASAFFAVDRFASYSTAWGAYYNSGGAVIADRYTTSNAIHQGAKLDSRERREFFRWLYDFEFNLMALPAPTLVLYLDLPADTALRRVRERARDGDIHERDGEYLAACIETGREAAEFYGWRAVNAARPAGEIHAELYEIVCGELL